MISRPSPNFDARPERAAISFLILHYTGMPDFEAALAHLCSPVSRVSAHYLIDENGAAFALVAETERAWHAGVSYWDGAHNLNGLSIGIELVNPGHEWGYRHFPDPQMAALEQLAGDVVKRHGIPAQRVLGHSDIAPARKQDPGEFFDWPRLAAQGIGLWPGDAAQGQLKPGAPDAALAPDMTESEVVRLQGDLCRFGYQLKQTGRFDRQTRCVVLAFQRHFRQMRCDGIADPETRGILAALLKLCETDG